MLAIRSSTTFFLYFIYPSLIGYRDSFLGVKAWFWSFFCSTAVGRCSDVLLFVLYALMVWTERTLHFYVLRCLYFYKSIDISIYLATHTHTHTHTPPHPPPHMYVHMYLPTYLPIYLPTFVSFLASFFPSFPSCSHVYRGKGVIKPSKIYVIGTNQNNAGIQRDSKICTQFRTSIFPELYMVCEWSI